MGIFAPSAFVEPFKEMVAYEAIWSLVKDPTFKRVGEHLQKRQPSSFLSTLSREAIQNAENKLKEVDTTSFNVLLKGTPSYPSALLALEDQLEILYYRGHLELLSAPAVSVVGARSASNKGLKAADLIARCLVKDNYAVISGLAEGIDTAAHTAAVSSGGDTVAIIGTPITDFYPKRNKALQELIAREHLLVSQVPFLRYGMQDYRMNRLFFPVRNKTMAALSEATIIVEASEQSGTLIQARECLRMRRKLIILKPTAEDKRLSWPRQYIAKGAHVAETYSDIRKILQKP